MARKNINKRHKHKSAKKNVKRAGNRYFAPVIILAVPVCYLAVVIIGAVNIASK